MKEDCIPFLTLYEDNHLLAVVKPNGIPTQPSDKDMSSFSLETELKKAIKKRDSKPSDVFLHAIFRLDKPVSGIALFAKSSKALKRLQQYQREQKYTKEYVALIPNHIEVGHLEDFLIRREFITDVVPKMEPHAKKAKLHILSCHPFKNNLYRIHIILETGRYHQIRAQLGSRGSPIVGDVRYGGKEENIYTHFFSPEAIALHHRYLCFPHPIQYQHETRYVSLTSEPSWNTI